MVKIIGQIILSNTGGENEKNRDENRYNLSAVSGKTMCSVLGHKLANSVRKPVSFPG